MRVCEQLQRDPQPARGARHHVHPVHTCTAGAAAASRCDARVVAALWHDHSARGRTTRALVPRRRRAAQAARRLRLRRRALVRLGLPRRLHPVTIQQVAIDVVRHKLHYRDLLWICRIVVSTTGCSVAEWLACWTRAQKGMGSSRSREAVE